MRSWSRTRKLWTGVALGAVLATVTVTIRLNRPADWVGIESAGYEKYNRGRSNIALFHVTNRTSLTLHINFQAEALIDGAWKDCGAGVVINGSANYYLNPFPPGCTTLGAVAVPDLGSYWRVVILKQRPLSAMDQRRLRWAAWCTASHLGWVGKLVQPRRFDVLRGPAQTRPADAREKTHD